MKHLISFGNFDTSINESKVQSPEFTHVALYENFTQVTNNLNFAITNKMICSIDYRGKPGSRILQGIRLIEPYALGFDSKGNMLVRAWMLKGISRSGRINPRLVPGWRLYRVEKIRSCNPVLQKFTVPRKGYNPKDSIMREVTIAAAF